MTDLKSSDADDQDWDFKEPSKALIACDGAGAGIVLEHCGGHIGGWLEGMCSNYLRDNGLDDAPKGLSIWEGTAVYTTSYEGETDGELEGEFRPLTQEEWSNLAKYGAVFLIEEGEPKPTQG